MAMPIRFAMLLFIACVLTGCAAPGPTTTGTVGRFVTQPGTYDAAFDIARDELVGLGFTIDRVDAYSGVISTKPKSSAGLATLWDREQASLRSEVADLAHPQQRTVRISFRPASEIDRIPTDEPITQITGQGAPQSIAETSTTEELVGVVEVSIERVYRPYKRVSTVHPVGVSRTRDPGLADRAMSSSFTVITQRDHALEARLASRIGSRLATN